MLEYASKLSYISPCSQSINCEEGSSVLIEYEGLHVI
ncbi:hypothetical protein LINPERHAP1_LOCUS21463 [Linum perenne]